MAIRYEPTQPGNPNELTHRQHVFPKRSIERFYQDGRVDFVDLSRGKRRQARADDKMFCGERAWSHGAEHGFMKDIEDAFQALAEAIIVDPDVALDHEQTETLIKFYGLWAHRARNRRLPFQTIRPKSRNLLGVRIECTEDELELLEKNNIIGTRPNGSWSMRDLMGSVIQGRIDDVLDEFAGRRWGVLTAAMGEFCVPDFPDNGVIPVTPTLALALDNERAYISWDNVGTINRTLFRNAQEHLFARSFARCPGLEGLHPHPRVSGAVE